MADKNKAAKPKRSTKSTQPKKDATSKLKEVADKTKTAAQSAVAEATGKGKKSSKTRKDGKLSNFRQKLAGLGVKTGPNKKLIVIAGVAAISALILTLGVFGFRIYKSKAEDRATRIAASVVPYPVLSVNGNVFWNTITYGEYQFELASIKKFYESQGQDLSSDEGKQRLTELKQELMKQLIDQQIITQEAARQRIKVSAKEVDDEYSKLAENAGGQDKVKETLQKLYGWTIDDFKSKIRFSLVQKKLADTISNDPSKNGVAKAKADDLLAQVKAGADFGELAKKNSEDTSASNGGDLGFIEKGQTVAEFEEASFKLAVGEVSGVVKTQYGYHIIKALEKQDDKVKVAHILIKGVDLESWLTEQREKAKVSTYLKI